MGEIGFINFAIDIFCLQSLLVSLLFCFRFEKRKHFSLRLLLSWSGCLVFFFLVPKIPFGFLNLSFILIFLINSLIIRWCFKIKWKQIAFYNAVSGTLQNLVAKLVIVLTLLGGGQERGARQLLINSLLFLLAVMVFNRIFIRKTKDNYNFHIPNIKLMVLMTTSVLVIFIFSPFADCFFTEVYARMFLCVNFIMIDFVVLFMAFGIFEKSYLENEKEIIGTLLHLQSGQLQQSEEDVERINRKCHDMLRTIELLEAEGIRSERNHYIAELKDTVQMYDVSCETGNRALDVILTRYGLVCREKKIRFSYIVDGAALSFLEDCDLFSFFGNALENAIEALSQEQDEAMRILEVLCKRKDDFVVVEIGNYFSGELSCVNGIPVTTKKKDGYHGYGIKSMRYVTEKNGGNLYVGKDNCFLVVRAVFCL